MNPEIEVIKSSIGKKFNLWTIVKFDGVHRGMLMVITKCDCGKILRSRWERIKTNYSKSCGCYRKLHAITHGLSDSKEYRIWASMIQRCENPDEKAFKWYGARGISVCEKWKDFSKFIEDMGDRPKGYSLDRIDTNGPYSKENCRWASGSIQSVNRRKRVGLSSKYRGVHKSKRVRKSPFTASITKNYKQYNLGSFKNEIDAAKAYDLKAIELYGENANLNFPKEIRGRE